MKVDDFQAFKMKVKEKAGVDLSQYKENQMKRRLTSLRDRRGFHTFKDYYTSMERDQALFDEFLERITINVTHFFRNKPQWTVLEKELPLLTAGRSKIKVWSAACSTGEEPYSLAMLLHSIPSINDFHILATDLDEKALDHAKRGKYNKESLKELSPDDKNNFFNKDDGYYNVLHELKQYVTFKQQNLLSDPFDTGFDLIVCRNVMIYFTEDTKKKLYQKFSRSLRTGGLLFVGNTEQIFQPQEYGLQLKHSFFYVKT
ncbi:CheR family methyltransferase [Alteribacillus iranensis]|uniref:protein-glutamate O-methyltransferase n=1 Tax=Alteribacillus iranensis TaxID=930128 RepID=A0A1I2DS17_9BACI|nr:protein-glutamate O-methyltransferase CheR [Alteribacillus iranensis]SFE83103.1 chemotaxis protein methyltransferase CheR [Alteribacillus iranensis]